MAGQSARLLRPHQWIKNGFCLAGLVFAAKAGELDSVLRALIAFAAFCAASSCIYALNDIFDREEDREHPVKYRRPVASGAVGIPLAGALAAMCLAAAVALGLAVGSGVLAIILAYMALNFAYISVLKHVALLDVMVIASGFLLRIFAGTEAIHAPTSAWILLCTFFLALFLGFGKRRAELVALGGQAPASRGVLSDYSVPVLDRYCTICAGLAMAAYALFAMSPGHDHTLIITCPPVAFGLFRYLALIEQRRDGEAPDAILLRDRPMQAAVGVFLTLHIAVLYFGLHLNIQ